MLRMVEVRGPGTTALGKILGRGATRQSFEILVQVRLIAIVEIICDMGPGGRFDCVR